MNGKKIILGIETSCDETAAAILVNKNKRVYILSNIISSSASLQEKYGGIIPEQAAREQLKTMIPAVEQALVEAAITKDEVDAIAVTYGPGLIGSLLVGVETAKTLAAVWQKPLIPVNHLIGHFYANWIETEQKPFQQIHFPCLGLLVSGGHTDLVLFKDHGVYDYLGGTRDDAAGECFDKCARLLGYPYPGGPKISKLAEKGNPKIYQLPVPMTESNDYDFSFSGLKTAFSNVVQKNFTVDIVNTENAQYRWKMILANELEGQDKKIADLCASLEDTIIKSIIKKVLLAVKNNKVEQLIIAGGVAANKKLSAILKEHLGTVSVELLSPPPFLCTDNGAMIAAAAFFTKPIEDPLLVQANPNLSL